MRTFILLLFFYLCLCISVPAAEPSIKVAVNSFTAINCPDSTPIILEELISNRIYQIDFMTLLDRQQMELLFKNNNLKSTGPFDNTYATKLGHVLSVDKMILGSVLYNGTFTITVKVIDIASSQVDLIITKKTTDSGAFSNAADEITKEIASFYRDGRKRPYLYNVQVLGGFMYPAGRFGRELAAGVGSSLCISDRVTDNDAIQLNCGLYRFFPKRSYISSFYLLSFSIQGQHYITLNDNLQLIASPGAGYAIGQKVYDRIMNRNSQERIFSTAYFYNPIVFLNAELRYRILDRISISAVFMNTMLGEKSYLNYFPGLAMGLDFNF